MRMSCMYTCNTIKRQRRWRWLAGMRACRPVSSPSRRTVSSCRPMKSKIAPLIERVASSQPEKSPPSCLTGCYSPTTPLHGATTLLSSGRAKAGPLLLLGRTRKFFGGKAEGEGDVLRRWSVYAHYFVVQARSRCARRRTPALRPL